MHIAGIHRASKGITVINTHTCRTPHSYTDKPVLIDLRRYRNSRNKIDIGITVILGCLPHRSTDIRHKDSAPERDFSSIERCDQSRIDQSRFSTMTDRYTGAPHTSGFCTDSYQCVSIGSVKQCGCHQRQGDCACSNFNTVIHSV